MSDKQQNSKSKGRNITTKHNVQSLSEPLVRKNRQEKIFLEANGVIWVCILVNMDNYCIKIKFSKYDHFIVEMKDHVFALRKHTQTYLGMMFYDECSQFLNVLEKKYVYTKRNENVH